MRILITGATGTIGLSVANALQQDGHELVCAARSDQNLPPGSTHVRVDFGTVPSKAWWAPHLQDIDVVINAVGIFTQTTGSSFQAVHTLAPIALFEAAEQAGVGLVIQLSALGSDDDATTDFHRSKFAADEALRGMHVRSVVVQPSLVYTPLGPSATLFNQLALLPLVLLPSSKSVVQPVHLNDLVDAIVSLVDAAPTRSFTVAAVGPQAVTLAGYLAILRDGLGAKRPQIVVPVPSGIVRTLVKLVTIVRPRLINPSAVEMLERGNSADVDSFKRVLGRSPRAIQEFLNFKEGKGARAHALLGVYLSLMKVAVALVWIVTGILSLGVYPVEDSLALLHEFGLQGVMAKFALYAGAVIDLLLGIALLLIPLGSAKWILAAQLAVMVGYTALITIQLPQWWLHPFGPILKNLPIVVATGMLMAIPSRS